MAEQLQWELGIITGDENVDRFLRGRRQADPTDYGPGGYTLGGFADWASYMMWEWGIHVSEFGGIVADWGESETLDAKPWAGDRSAWGFDPVTGQRFAHPTKDPETVGPHPMMDPVATVDPVREPQPRTPAARHPAPATGGDTEPDRSRDPATASEAEPEPRLEWRQGVW